MNLCACGCGKAAAVKFHRDCLHKAPRLAPRWRSGRLQERQVTSGGYVLLYVPDHPQANKRGKVKEHRVIVERAMGKVLRVSAPVHHVNGTGTDNRHANLVACDSQSYHLLLHERQRALDACGHAEWEQCFRCREWEPADQLSHSGCKKFYHPTCINAYNREKYAERRKV